jgi:hypothetical protein
MSQPMLEDAVLIDDLRGRAEDPARRTDMGRQAPLPEPARHADLRRAEEVLGCQLPQVITGVYSAIANGGFGPGYGLVGIGGGRAGFVNGTTRRHCEEEYAAFRQMRDFSWPAHLLPVCDWGCGIYSCVDASRPDAPLFTSFSDLIYDDPVHAVTPPGCGFADWLRAWADGQDLWQALMDAAARVADAGP